MRTILSLGSVVALAVSVAADEPCRSGLKPNQRPGPYTSLVAVGPQRGQSHCFICETVDRPMAIVFARTLSDGLGKLVHGIDKAVTEHKTADLRAWVTFLAEDQPKFDPLVVDWGKKHAIANVPLGVFEDLIGPPTYLLSAEADVTVLLAVKQKVIYNFAFRKDELTDRAIAEVLKAVPKIVKK